VRRRNRQEIFNVSDSAKLALSVRVNVRLAIVSDQLLILKAFCLLCLSTVPTMRVRSDSGRISDASPRLRFDILKSERCSDLQTHSPCEDIFSERCLEERLWRKAV
jgi:hypothetical protein